ncbi:hypothetical protein NNJEOMEG_01688 [Fundidesulfovibrio magnetotacticus]|uniref:4Fe-4S ferredoxin-type domain-containing protein n=1 Tax=Fundidesulfovibrio magnetotacticus TaxID=2730080 RepID=A0A6V8LME8_9BACT|nr:4Fe-4S ferredoxin [Fundidesulfovibrio magnetotacticus]GFK93852.1 hypothetical protein NNJEOMEG_01688 [Fundidesulfovibrio magnetotacticus]
MEELARAMAAWMDDRAHNALEPGSSLPAFDAPLLGCASGADPLFARIRADIGEDFYWSPAQAHAWAFPDDPAEDEELSVIAWVLPQTRDTRQAHRKARELPSAQWSKARHYGEQVNEALRRHVVELLAARGVRACAPALLPQWGRAVSERFGFASTWSERHAAHVCGLGCFGLSDGLITRAGKAVRVGSVVARAAFAPTPRPYERHDEWCLRARGVPCRACMKRCPAGAISEAGHDKGKCKAYIRGVTAPWVASDQLGFPVNSCGFCQTGTPCEAGVPPVKKSR